MKEIKAKTSAKTKSSGSNPSGNKDRPWFDKVSRSVTKAAGRPATFAVACGIVLLWGVLGPVFDYSDTWQLVINTSTTIITFLMVFVIQQSQNRDTTALQLKINELLASQKNASNRLVDAEDLTEDELEVLKKFYVKLSTLSRKDSQLYTTHSIDEAAKVHERKKRNASGRNQA